MSNVSISEEDLSRLLKENDHMRKQVTELQSRGTELLLENRELKAEVKNYKTASENTVMPLVTIFAGMSRNFGTYYLKKLN